MPENIPIIEEKDVKYKPITTETELLKAEILIPHISRQGKIRLREVAPV